MVSAGLVKYSIHLTKYYGCFLYRVEYSTGSSSWSLCIAVGVVLRNIPSDLACTLPKEYFTNNSNDNNTPTPPPPNKQRNKETNQKNKNKKQQQQQTKQKKKKDGGGVEGEHDSSDQISGSFLTL